MKNKIWLSTPHMGGAEQRYIQEAFDQNWIAPLGPNINNLEEDLKFFLDRNVHVAALSSGTAAVHIALIMLGVKKDDEVICQTFTFSASANPVIYLGAKPIFVDSEEDTWNICPKTLELAIKSRIEAGKKPKAIVLVHLYGMPAKLHDIIEVAKKYDIPVIEDAAEALGSEYKGQKCGTFGEIGVLSFNGNKIITTSGGGALVFKSSERKDRAVFLATQAKDHAPHYEHTEIGYNYRMSNISAGIGRGQMEVLHDRILKRRQNHQFYVDLFFDKPGVKVFSEPNGDYLSNHWLSVITIDEEIAGFSRENLRLSFEKENIETRPLWKPLHLQPVFKGLLYYGKSVAEDLFRDGLCLPSGSNLSENDKERIREVVESCFSEKVSK